MLIDGYDIPGFCNIYKECLDSEYVQSIIAEFIVKKSDNSQLTKLGKKEELEEIIENNIYFSEEKKDNLKKILAERMRFAVKEKIFKEITDFIPSTTLKSIEEISLEQLDLQIHSLNRLRKSGINLVKQLIGKTEEDLMKIEDLTSGNIEDIIEKIQSCGVEIIDGHLEVTKPELSIEEQIEEEINSSDVLMEDEKEMLREYLGKKSLKMNVEEKSSLLGIEVNVDSSEISKEDFVNNILEKQKIVANQYKEITKISLKKNEK